jgi:hypothetical protein
MTDISVGPTHNPSQQCKMMQNPYRISMGQAKALQGFLYVPSVHRSPTVNFIIKYSNINSNSVLKCSIWVIPKTKINYICISNHTKNYIG